METCIVCQQEAVGRSTVEWQQKLCEKHIVCACANGFEPKLFVGTRRAWTADQWRELRETIKRQKEEKD